MRLVVDTSILFSFFNEKSQARELSTLPSLELHSPRFALDEIDEHNNKIKEEFSLSELQFSLILKLLQTVVDFVKSEEYVQFLPRAKELSPDIDDVDFFALALKYNCGIWSNDPHFKQQSEVETLTTEELLEKLEMK